MNSKHLAALGDCTPEQLRSHISFSDALDICKRRFSTEHHKVESDHRQSDKNAEARQSKHAGVLFEMPS